MYVEIKENKVLSWCENAYLNHVFIDVDYSEFNQNMDKYKKDEKGLVIIDENNLPILNPNYEQEQAQKEAERIGKLTVTKRVFALALQQLGVTYSQLKELIATSEQAQLEWDLCVELVRNNPMLDLLCPQMGITSSQLDCIFRVANGETVEQETQGQVE